MRSQSAGRSMPSIFQMSGSTPASWSSRMDLIINPGRTSLSYRSASPPTPSSCGGSAGTSSSNRNFRSCWCSQSDSRLSRSVCRRFISVSPSGL